MENSELIAKALRYINRASGKSDMTVEDVANHAGFSADYFNRIFFAHTGFNVMEYVRFSRLKKAARLLRTDLSADILGLALDCGYEAHESFSRAFKAQYGLSPTEYRKKYERTEAFYGDFYNDTIGARLVREFTDFRIADRDEVIDFLLEKNAILYGYEAVCFRVNGGAALYDGEDFRDGFIWFTEWDDRIEGDIFCDDMETVVRWLKTFSGERFDMMVSTTQDEAGLRASLGAAGANAVSMTGGRNTYVYTGEPYDITPPEGYSMRLLTYDDYDLIVQYFDTKYPGEGSNKPRMKHLQQELYQRDILGNDEHSVFMFGIFKDGGMVGISDGGLQRAHGFCVNNCVYTSFLEGHESEALYQYAFKFVTNAALGRGALPIDDAQTPGTPEEDRCGAFVSEDLGYRFAYRWFRVRADGKRMEK